MGMNILGLQGHFIPRTSLSGVEECIPGIHGKSWHAPVRTVGAPACNRRLILVLGPDSGQGGVQITQHYMCKPKKTRSSGGWKSRGLNNGESLGEDKVF